VKTENPIIDFGRVIFGEESFVEFKLENFGALDTEVLLKNAKG
jgi:hypothetical protein